jgi:NAD/NADP transhydrogenase alpha subunit
MELKFAKVLPEDFSAKEKKAVEEAIKEIDKKLKE